MNKKGFAISGIIYSILILFLILMFGVLSLLGSRKMIFDKVKKEVIEELTSNIQKDKRNEPNEPQLFTNMIPVVYNTSKSSWVYASVYEKWYDYSNQEWANAVILKKSPSKTYSVGDSISMDDIAQMYVWIPRYKYTIFNGNNGSVNEQLINVEFERGTETTGTVRCHDAVSGSGTSSEVCTDSTQENDAVVDGISTYTHPAFCLGRKDSDGDCTGTELTGLWIGKFEVSGEATAANLTVLPNKNPLVSTNVSTYFTAMSGISNSFNLKDDNNIYADSHMMKNMDWGAVAYLKQSSYGLGTTDIALNNYYDESKSVYYMTGCGSEVGTSTTTTDCIPYDDAIGQKASTTGNIYGVYDMNGGTWEYVMGNMVNTSGEFYVSEAGSFSLVSKYYDAYTYDGSSYTTHGRGKLGDATKEALKTFGSNGGGWYNDNAGFPNSSYPWFVRGGSSYAGSNAGVFHLGNSGGGGGSYYSSRPVITGQTVYNDKSGANSPELFTNMIPVIYNEKTSKWKYADIYTKWYDYEDQEWANAVILKAGKSYSVGNDIEIDDIAQMYVWIPRYKYTIFNGNNESVNEQLINVTFEKGTATTGTVRCHDAVSGSGTSSEVCTDSTNGGIVNGKSTYTHPSFCLGRKNIDGSCNGTELTGLWIGKFEVSGSATASNLTVLPNKNPLVSTTVSSFFTAMSGISNSFNIKDDNNIYADSHMMKNMDWGAVAYLKQSEYGLGTTDIALNNYYDTSKSVYFMTGCGSEVGTTTTTTTCAAYHTANGQAASTTGNIYGVYDMSGGAWDYVMGNIVNASGAFYPVSAGTFSLASKYYDAYTYNESTTTHGRGKLGDATKETLAVFGNVTGGWYDDHAGFPYSSESWFTRGGYANNGTIAGVFYIHNINGGGNYRYSSRPVITGADIVEPNEPQLFTNMIPVTYNTSTSKWTYANKDSKWYDYDNQEWANAVILKAGKSYTVGNDIDIEDIAQMYVWIPRYKYTIFNGNNGSVNEQLINVTFERGTETTGTVKCYDAVSGSGTSSEVCTDSAHGSIINGKSTYTHPAFCLGTKNTDGSCDGTELTGIWVGKFEISGEATAANLTVLPNKNPIVSTNVSTYFTAMSGVSNSFNIKDKNNNLADSHMMKNMDWGAVAYLKQSEYGLGTTDIALNNYGDRNKPVYYMTGCGSAVGAVETTTTCSEYDTTNGMKASTTGNIYGVYDMAGGAWDYVMGNIVDTSGNFGVANAGTFSPNERYYEAYTYNTSHTTHGRGKLGDATKETLKTFGSETGGWYSDYAYFPYLTHSWFVRGSSSEGKSNVGIFAFSSKDGSENATASSRLVITAPTTYTDGSGANEPELFTNMIPVTYNTSTSKWTYANVYEKWYDYNNKQWANAVVLKANPSQTYTVGNDIKMSDIAQMYVWIPRYKYTIFNGNNGSVNEQLINVTFEPGTRTTGSVRCYDAVSGTAGTSSEVCTDSTNGSIKNGTSTYTHPAFCLGRKKTDGSCNGTELEGIWVGKFETSGTATAANLTVLPNVNPLVSQTISTYFTAMSGVSSSFNLKDENNTYADSHMMKNMEWGAVAYLKQSEYGLGTTDIALNNYRDTSQTVYYMTGCGSAVGTTATTTTCTPYNEANGQAASTTGNIYGVYDMSGGAWEYVMGNMVNESGEFYPSSAGTFSSASSAEKYYDAYTYNTSATTQGRGKLGDATKETLKTFGSTSGGWYSDYATFPYSTYSWFMRGGASIDGANAGVFNFHYTRGDVSHSARLVISRP